MESKFGELLIVNELDRRSNDSDTKRKDRLHTASLLVQTPSSQNNTLTQTLESDEDVLDSGCQTPTEFIFEPFLTGPEELCLAPKRKCGTRNPFRRRLSVSFDLSEVIDSEKEFEESVEKELPSICKSFLDLKDRLHTASLLVQTPSSQNSTLTQTLESDEDVLDSGCQTPTEFIFEPFLTGPEELCLAPKRKCGTRNPFRRRLSVSFDLSEVIDSEKEFEESVEKELPSICKSFLDLKDRFHTASLLVQTPSSQNSTLTQTLESDEDVLDSGCQTPTEFIFEPFLTGPEELCLAPKRKCGTRNPFRRRLSVSFDLSEVIDSQKEFEDSVEKKLPSICKSFLDLIIADVLEICEEKLLSDEEQEEDGLKTPTDIPLLTGFADVCPGAPVIPALKLQSNLKREFCTLCRKLDFDSDLD